MSAALFSEKSLGETRWYQAVYHLHRRHLLLLSHSSKHRSLFSDLRTRLTSLASHLFLFRSRDKMTVDQLLEEAKMLDKTWRYKEALASYEQALQCDQGCLAALYGKAEMLRQLNRPEEAKAAYE